jgi:DNA polymerase III delta subunit
MLGWQVHNMLLVKANIDMRDNELAGKAGMAPFVVQKTKRLVRSMQLVQIKQLIDLVLAAERDLKTTGMDGHRRTRHLIYQIAKTTTS